MTRPACEWFAACLNPADGFADGGPLGMVPCCRRCADRVGVTLTPAESFVICDDCGERHTAEYDHQGRFGEGSVYAVVCGDFVEMYTAPVVEWAAAS